MTQEFNQSLQGIELRGPKAPKDPTKKRMFLYVMMDTPIEASARKDNKPSQEFYLDNMRIIDMVQLASGFTDEKILNLLGDCAGFHKLVHSIGVSVKSEADPGGALNFVLQNWGKTNIYETGTKLEIPCPKDGTEVVFRLEDFSWKEEDDVVGKFGFEFDQVGEMAVATVRLFLQDGYEVPEIIVEDPVNYNSADYKAMISGSLLNLGNTYRLQKAIRKANCGEEVTIAYIGGSITQGAGAKPINTGSYAYKSYQRFKELFGKDEGKNIRFVKAGVGGTPSELGMLRYERDVLRNGEVQPDIVVIEFAVNDAGDETNGVCFESLCLKALNGPGNPAVILLFSVFLNDWNLQDRLAPIGFHYNLPMVSVKDAVVDQFMLTKDMGNVISKRQFFFDVYHPTNDGHTVMADCLSYLFTAAEKADEEQTDLNLNQAPILGNWFSEVQLIDRKEKTELVKISEGSFTGIDQDLQAVEIDEDSYTTPQFPNNWMHSEGTGQEDFVLVAECRSLLLIFKDSGSSTVGKADIYVDGVYLKTLDPHEINWTHCNAVILFREETKGNHEIRIRMSEEDQDKCFTILGFGIVK